MEYSIVQGAMASPKLSVVSPSVVNVVITSSSNSFPSERRFQKNITIAELKMKLELITGASAQRMKLELYSKDNELVTSLEFNDALLGSYPVEDGMRINVVDKALLIGEFEDTSKVEKFELTPEEYAKKSDSVLAFKMRNKIGRFNPELAAKIEADKDELARQERDLVLKMNVGQRCEVHVPKQPSKRGTLMFIGETSFKPGYWIGVKYDEPLGKNDGSVNGKRYFDCLPKYGAFIKPQHVEIGDFPEEDFDLNENEEDEI